MWSHSPGAFGMSQSATLIRLCRRELYKLKKAVERETGNTCGIIYGSLPPDVRSLQAKKFNDGECPPSQPCLLILCSCLLSTDIDPADRFSVLVASDAIGMGLNLHIKRVVFSTMEKYNGHEAALLLGIALSPYYL